MKAKTVKGLMVSASNYPHIPGIGKEGHKTVNVSLINVKKQSELPVVLVLDNKYNLQGPLTLGCCLRGAKIAIRRPGQRKNSESISEMKSFGEGTDSMEKAASLMVKDDVDLLHVVDDRGGFVGLVRILVSLKSLRINLRNYWRREHEG